MPILVHSPLPTCVSDMANYLDNHVKIVCRVANKSVTSRQQVCCVGIWETTRHNRHNGLLTPAHNLLQTCYGFATGKLRGNVSTGVWPSVATNGIWPHDKLPISSVPLTPMRNVNPNGNQNLPTHAAPHTHPVPVWSSGSWSPTYDCSIL